MVEFYFSDKFTTIMNAVYDYVKLADELVREEYEKIRQKDEEPSPSWMGDELREVLEERTPKIRDFYESNDGGGLFSMPQDISESRFGIGLLLEKERYNFNLNQLFTFEKTFPLIGTWLGGMGQSLDLSEIYKEYQVELITLYVCRIFFNNDLIIESSEIDYLNPNGWDKWNNKYSSNEWYQSATKLDKKYSELKDLLDKNASNNIVNWEQGSEFEGIYTRIRGSGGGDSGRTSFSYIPLWILLNNIQSIYIGWQYPEFDMMPSNRNIGQFSQKFDIEFKYLITNISLKRTILNRLSNLEDDEGLPFRGKGEGLSPYALINQIDIDWFRDNGVEVKAQQVYTVGVDVGNNNTDWLDANKLGRGGRGVDSAIIKCKQEYKIIINGEVKDSWQTSDDSWSFGLTGQFSINEPDIPNKLYQSLEYKITGLISNYLVLKPINYPYGLYIKLPSQKE